MTRIEVLTDTAFAFAFTMLVISLNELPRSWDALAESLKQLPALLASFMQIMLFWYGHVKWSRRFGLEDVTTVWLSGALIFVMLVFVYLLRLLFSSAFAWLTGGWLPPEITIDGLAGVRGLFLLYGAGFFLLSALLMLLNAHALRLRSELALSALEVHATRGEIQAMVVFAGTAAVSMLFAAVLDGGWLALAGMVYGTLGFSMPAIAIRHDRRKPPDNAAEAGGLYESRDHG
ncbi:MAG: TMEM175 family protein [Gammaproteobacteria bacterium]